jgi:murein DD-endopeptidase MepM/ murein hydrolase activator NlpD
MTKEEKLIRDSSPKPSNIVDMGPSDPVYVQLDLSCRNEELLGYDITDSVQCQSYIDKALRDNKADVAYGGYLEQRNLYQKSTHFTHTGRQERNIHLGVDLWVKATTPVIAPLKGRIHSFSDNEGYGNYGPTIILEHNIAGLTFYTLYGHLSKTSLSGLKVGKKIQQGSIFATLGNSMENGGYAPHLHLQIILDPEGYRGDYPGVCARQDINFYQKNCPDPNLLLNI